MDASRIYEGPLDLLLDEVRRQKVAIEEVAIAPMAARFLEYVRGAASRNLHLDMEWLHMAAVLIHWKSQALLPVEPSSTQAPDGIRDALVRQLAAHRDKVAEELGRFQSREARRFSRSGSEFPAPSGEAAIPEVVTVWDMIREARGLALWLDEYRGRRCDSTVFAVDPDEVTIAEMCAWLRDRVSGCGSLEASGLLTGQRMERRCLLFRGMLEMARSGEIVLEQAESFGPIVLRSNPEGVKPTVGS